jgi:hypothetical protein
VTDLTFLPGIPQDSTALSQRRRRPTVSFRAQVKSALHEKAILGMAAAVRRSGFAGPRNTRPRWSASGISIRCSADRRCDLRGSSRWLRWWGSRAKAIRHSIETALIAGGAPEQVLGIAIAVLVLMPETWAAVRAA